MSAEAIREERIRIGGFGGVEVRLLEAGDGPPIVLVHGLGATAEKWRDLLPHLAPHGRAVAPDLPGFGRSDAPRARYTPGWLAGAVRAVMDERGIDRAVLVGNSLGGTVALWFAGAWPERVESLVLVGAALPPVPGQRFDREVITHLTVPLIPGLGELLYVMAMRMRAPEDIVAQSLAATVADPARVPSETVDRLVEEAVRRRSDPAARRALFSAHRSLVWTLTAHRERVRSIVNRLAVPALLLWGEHDRLVPPIVGEHWVREFPDAELVILEGAGHNPQMEIPDRVAGTILTFAAKARARRAAAAP